MARRCPWLLGLVALLAVARAAAGESATGTAPPGLAGLAGERLEYRVRWGPLPVASAALEVEPGAGATVVLRATARSRGWIDAIYPVRDLVESTVLAAELRPLRFFKNTKEGRGEPVEVEVEFDRAAGVARYVRNGEALAPLVLPPEFQDPLSCLYAYRVLAAGGAAEVGMEVTDGKRVIPGSFRELRRETVRTPAGEFAAIVVEPKIEGLGGVFRKSRKSKLRIWLTDDEWRRPVRFYAEVAVGGFTMELVRLEVGGYPEPDSPQALPGRRRPPRAREHRDRPPAHAAGVGSGRVFETPPS